MLLLGRNDGEEIYINGGFDNGGITIRNCGPGMCRIGVQASKDVQVDRKEIFESKLRDLKMKKSV